MASTSTGTSPIKTSRGARCADSSTDLHKRCLHPLGLAALLGAVALAGCSSVQESQVAQRDPKLGVTPSPRVVADGRPIPKGGGVYRVGKAYEIAGKSYTPSEAQGYAATGLASWYGDAFHGRLTANGEIYDRDSLSAAHPTLPLPSYVRVTNVSNGRSIVVRVNDRGPYHGNRLIDVSRRTAQMLGFERHGVARVKVDYVGLASLKGSDDRKLLATYSVFGRPVSGAGDLQVASLDAPPAPPPPAPLRQAALTQPSYPEPMLRGSAAQGYSAAPAPAGPALRQTASAVPEPMPPSPGARTPATIPAAATAIATEAGQPRPEVSQRIAAGWGTMSAPMPLSAPGSGLPAGVNALRAPY